MADEIREEKPFDRDVATHGAYVYTSNERFSTKTAMARQSDMIAKAMNFTNKRVIDIGCGDGATTNELYDRHRPSELLGIEPSAGAIAVATAQANGRPIRFAVSSGYAIDAEAKSFDVALLRGVLHHMDHPDQAIAEAARVAKAIVIMEPNGLNPLMKLIEKTSTYHREHGERSYLPRTIDRWIREAGMKVASRQFGVLVPYFCPDTAARILARLQPFAEVLPLANRLVCGTYVVAAA